MSKTETVIAGLALGWILGMASGVIAANSAQQNLARELDHCRASLVAASSPTDTECVWGCGR